MSQIHSLYRRIPELLQDRAIVVGIYSNREAAGDVLKRLRVNGILRSAAIHNLDGGKVLQEDFDVSPGRGIFLGALAGLICSGIILFIRTILNHHHITHSIFMITLLLPFLGALIAYILAVALDMGVRDDVLGKYRRWVLRGESMVIAQVLPVEMVQVRRWMLDTFSGSSGIFMVHPGHHFPAPAEGAPLRQEPLTSEGLQRQADRLATIIHPVTSSTHTGRPLLQRLAESENVLQHIRHDLADAARMDQTISLSAEWILDNMYIIQTHVDDVRRNMPKKYYQELPIVADGQMKGLPRVYAIASELVADTDARLEERNIINFIQAYQSKAVLTMGELWAIPMMMRIRLIECLHHLILHVDSRQHERELADFWANRLLNAVRNDPDQLLPLLAELAREKNSPSANFSDQLIGHLYDEEAALSPVRSWLERKLNMQLGDAIQQEQKTQALEQVSLANAITSLRTLSQLDWRQMFEQLSRVHYMLNGDPDDIYLHMDFSSRDKYRHIVEQLARRSRIAEADVVRKTLDLADKGSDSVERHVGYYLVDEGIYQLEKQLGSQVPVSIRILRYIKSHSATVYLGSITLLTVPVIVGIINLLLKSGTPTWATGLVAFMALIPASEIAVQLVNYLITRLIHPDILPKMNFEKGIPHEAKTLVVVPMMLLTPESIREDVERLEVRYLANSEDNLIFGLLSDYSDSPVPNMPEDAERLDVAIHGIEQLNLRYGQRFYLFHRDRKWCDSERHYIGWERKRGKLEQLNRFLMGERDDELDSMLRIGDPVLLQDVHYIITLDADTQLPHDAARRMVETISHPLNSPRLNDDGKSIRRGFSIIQPRVSTSLPSATATYFARLFTDASGADPYTQAVSDLYQDLTGEGSYHGKGIYDLHAFHQVLNNRFPESHLLSHDLIEGAYVRVGLASDIELFDLFPRDYLAHCNRQHRWVRGDWQIMDWIFSSVPDSSGYKVPTILNAINRWKIADNLRRSLLSPTIFLMLLSGWWFTKLPFLVSVIAGTILILPVVLQQLSRWTTPRSESSDMNWNEPFVEILRALVTGGIIPHQALLSTDAITRVFYRRLVSHHLLLEWQTAQEVQKNTANRLTQFEWKMAWLSLFAACLSILTGIYFPQAETATQLFILLWIMAPLVLHLLHHTVSPQVARPFTGSEQKKLREIARQTWRFFEEFVNDSTNHLPPDNYQEFLLKEVAQRTSPTNIGLYLLSILAANDFGYITVEEAIERHQKTLDSVGNLEKYSGHLLNWYQTNTLEPLLPRYVSMVDSGNFLASLWADAQGIEELLNSSMLTQSALNGLQDTQELLSKVITREKLQQTSHETHYDELDKLLKQKISGSVESLIKRIRIIRGPVMGLKESVCNASGTDDLCRYWALSLELQVEAWNTQVDRYLAWVEILSGPLPNLLPLGQEAHEWRKQALETFPSLRQLARGDVPGLSHFMVAQQRAGELNLPKDLMIWLQKLNVAALRARNYAADVVGKTEKLLENIYSLSEGMDMAFLYDPDRRIFITGFNVSERRRDNSCYDLLASEARLGSFVAIARGDVPVQHWWALGRPYGLAYGQRALLSWSGTMFEYLMPLILTRRYEHSLLDQACRTAVICQIDYARKRGIPWGISEAAFSALDAHQIYQYRAFGVPGLGLKRGLEEDLVVAPYASALALMVNPQAALKNLIALGRLARLGMRGGFGYYESVDYTRQQSQQGERGVIVYAWMAHHQGMIFLSVVNALKDNIMQRRFHSVPRVRATESLLYERIPANPAIAKDYARESPPPRLASLPSNPISGRVDAADTPTPRTHLLANGEYSLMLTNSGGGYSRWKDMDITRWRADITTDCWGSFLYIRDTETGNLMCNTYQPLRKPFRRYHVLFSGEKTEFHRVDPSLETMTEIVVSPEDNAEIRRITLINQTNRPRKLELTSYQELAMAPHAADRSHPAFIKLFVQTEALPERQAILAWRRIRSPEDPSIWTAHLIAMPERPEDPPGFETDRSVFLGRGRSPHNPIALEQELTGSQGAVLDPIFSLRRTLPVVSGGRTVISFITLVAESREALMRLVDKYTDYNATTRAFEVAWTHAQLELRHLRIQEDDAQRYQQLASHILYPHNYLRPPVERLRRNTRGQATLWSFGISGDLPIVLLTIGDSHDIDMVQEVLQAHNYWRVRGLKVDLLVLNEEATGYDQPLLDLLKKMVQANSQHTGIDQPGGVFLRSAELISPEDLNLLHSAARVVLVAARGNLSQQLGIPWQPGRLPGLLLPNSQISEEPSARLPFMDLPYFNGMGGFSQDGSEYCIYLGPGKETPAPWVNVCANPSFGMVITESGGGFVWQGNSQCNRLTPWSNDPVSDPVSDAIYIRDEEMGVYWTPTPGPIREIDAYRCRHGQGYTIFEHNSHAIEQELITFVPINQDGGDPIRVQCLRLKNCSSTRRRLSVTCYNEWTLGIDREDTQMHIITHWEPDINAVTARNAYNPDYGEFIAFAASYPLSNSYTCDRTEFLGRNGSAEAPAAMDRTGLSGRYGPALDPCSALQVVVEIEPDQQADVIFLLGQAHNANEVRELIRHYRDRVLVESALDDLHRFWDVTLGAIQVETPDKSVNIMLNRWLQYQNLSCRLWGRSGFYQSGGAYGFRDQLQDSMAMVYSKPDITREQILRSAARQFPEGDVQHWWHPQSGAGVRTRISDDLLWLPWVTIHYVRVTGDRSILEEQIPFIDGMTLKDHEHEIMFVPSVSTQKASLQDHCTRAIRRGLTEGPQGLPLIGGGDWNDGFNRVGQEGKGESVWLAWFLIRLMNDYADILDTDEEYADELRRKAAELATRVDAVAWDGEWYHRAYYDDGTPLGTHLDEEAKIDSLAQSWAVISGSAPKEHAETAMRSVKEMLVREKEGMILLFTPPFDHTEKDPGYIKGYLPGVRENGGQYTHGSLWVPLAFARMGEGKTAYDLLRMMLPVEHARDEAALRLYCVEPYVATADIYSLPQRVGRGGWTWYTGSAAWMYRIWLEEVLGFKLRNDRFTMDPVITPQWKRFSLNYQYGSATYQVEVENPDQVEKGVVFIELDGVKIEKGWITLSDEPVTHKVRVLMGKTHDTSSNGNTADVPRTNKISA